MLTYHVYQDASRWQGVAVSTWPRHKMYKAVGNWITNNASERSITPALSPAALGVAKPSRSMASVQCSNCHCQKMERRLEFWRSFTLESAPVRLQTLQTSTYRIPQLSMSRHDGHVMLCELTLQYKRPRTHAQDLDQITWLNTVLWQYHTATSWTATIPYHAFHRRSVEFKSALTIGDYPAHTPLHIPQQRYRLALLPRFHLHLLQHFQKDLYNQFISNLIAAWASSDWPVASLSLPFRL